MRSSHRDKAASPRLASLWSEGAQHLSRRITARLPTQGCAFKPCPSRFRRRKTASARDPKRRSLPDDCFGEINIAALLNHSSATCNDANGFIDSTALEPIYVARYSL